MTKNRLLLGLALLAGAIVVWCLWQGRRPGQRPSANGSVGGSPLAVDAVSVASGGQVADDAAVSATLPTPPDRVEVTDPTSPDERPCTVDVLVVAEATNRQPRPAACVDVELRLADQPSVAAMYRTDGAGRARFTLRGGDRRAVDVSSGIGGRANAVLSATTTTTITIRVPTRVVVRGRVVAADGLGIEDADLMLLRWPDGAADPDGTDGDGREWLVGRSSPNGEFEIALAVGGRLGATHAAYSPSALYLIKLPPVAAAAAPEQVLELVLLTAPVQVLGTVRDALGLPVAGARLQFLSAAKVPAGAELASAPRRTSSDEHGAFTVEKLPPGPIRWAARRTGHGWIEGQFEAQPGVPTQLEVILPTAAAVSGVVVATDGTPVAGARVAAGAPRSWCRATTYSGQDGSFRLEDLGSGTVPLHATHRTDGSARTTVELQPGISTQWRAVLVAAGEDGMLRGLVTDTEQRPLAGWRVVIRQRDHEVKGSSTDEHGRFAVAASEPRGFDVRAFAPGRELTSFADAMRQDVDARQGVVHLIVGSAATTAVRGRVTTSDFQGAAAQIDFWHHERREWARFTATADGGFELPAVPIGSVDITIAHQGCVKHEVRGLQLQVGLVADLGIIQLARGGGLFGTVTGPDRLPPKACKLSITTPSQADGNPGAANPGDAAADAQPQRIFADYVGGTYRLSGVPPGKHKLYVEGPGLASTSVEVKITAGVDTMQDIELRQGLRRRVLVTVPPGASDRVTLGLVPANGNEQSPHWLATAEVARTSPDKDGIAEFFCFMAAGSYEARATTRSGHHARTRIQFAYEDEPDVSFRLQR